MLTADDMAILIDVANVDLHRGMVLGSDKAARGGTSGQVALQQVKRGESFGRARGVVYHFRGT